ncbi:MAG: exo-alpha-sialidase, partial [Verrucomicrobia bacterium]
MLCRLGPLAALLALAGWAAPGPQPPPDWPPGDRLSAGGLSLLAPPMQPPAARRPEARSSPALREQRPPHLGPDQPIGAEPDALPEDLRAQAEPHVARSFFDPGLVLATWQEGRYGDGGAFTCGYAVSHDGGVNWDRGFLPGLAGGTDDPMFLRASDPVAAVGRNDLLVVCTLGINGVAPEWVTSVVVNRSLDGGRSWERPIVVAESDTSQVFLDKNWIAANTFPGTATFGRLVVTITRFHRSVIGGTTSPIALSWSDDDGLHWSPLQIVTGDAVQGSQPVFLPDGSLALAYWNFEGNLIEVMRSPDGGETFGQPVVVAEVEPYRDPHARSAEFLPSLAADRTLGGLYLVWQARPDVPRILFSRSMDGGRTWTEPKPVNDTPNGAGVFNPAIAASPDGLHLAVIFYDKRHDDGSGYFADLYLAESFDGGQTWQPNVRLSRVSSDLRHAPLATGRRMLGDYQGVAPPLNLATPGVAVWIDARDASPDPFAATFSRRRGARFADWQALVWPEPTAPEAAAGADPDHDGRPNLIEYGQGTSPLRAESLMTRTRPAHAPASAWHVDWQAAATDFTPGGRLSRDMRLWETGYAARLRAPDPLGPAFNLWQVAPRTAADGAVSFFRPGASPAPGSG